MKKVIPLFSVVFILLIFMMSGQFIFFKTYIKIQKSDFRNDLIAQSNEKTNTLIFTAKSLFKNENGFEWKEKNKELVINGVYHEVLSIKKCNGGFQVTIIEDKNENELFQNYFSFNKKAKKSLTDLAQFLSNINYLEIANVLLPKQSSQDVTHIRSVLEPLQTIYPNALLKPPGKFLNS